MSGEDHVPRDVLALGWALASPEPGRVQRALRLAPRHDLYRTLRFNKVAALASELLSAAAVPEAARPAVAAIAEDVRRQQARISATSSVWQRLCARAEESGTVVALVKGGGVRTWYDRPERRHLGDLDLWVPDERSAWELVRWLRSRDWDYNPGELPWRKRGSDGRGYGVVNLVSVSGDHLSVDVHYGDYSVRHCGRVALSAGDLVGQGTPAVRMRDEKLLLSMMGNAAGDHFVTMKDINDIVLLARRDGVDWTEVRSLLRQSALTSFAEALARAAAWAYEGCAEAGPALEVIRRELCSGGRLEAVGWGRSTPARARARTTTRHAWEVSRGFGPAGRFLATVTAAVYYRAELRPRLVRTLGGPLPPFFYRGRPWRCVRLIPPARMRELLGEQAGDHGAAPDANRTFVRNGDAFVPTVWGRVTRRAAIRVSAPRARDISERQGDADTDRR